MVEFTVEGEIIPKQSAKFKKLSGGRIMSYQPKKVSDYAERVAMSALKELSDSNTTHPAHGPLIAIIDCLFRRPKNHFKSSGDLSKKGRTELYCMKNKDLDNIAKNILDGMQGVVFCNDKQVIDLRVKKEWTEGKEAIYVKIIEVFS
jgi:Holliday junction resolvase RusA-like endonuclease